jgi:hypothetical protein
LPVTFRDFNEYGIHWNSIAPAIREAEALGLIRITQQGIASNKEFRIPNMFALTHLATDKNPKPTEDWKRIKTIEEAEEIAAEARKTPAGFAKFKRKKNAGSRYGKRSEPQYGKRSEEGKNLNTESVSLSNTESVSLSISFVESIADATRRSRLAFDWNDEWERYCDSLPLFTAALLPATSLVEVAL